MQEVSGAAEAMPSYLLPKGKSSGFCSIFYALQRSRNTYFTDASIELEVCFVVLLDCVMFTSALSLAGNGVGCVLASLVVSPDSSRCFVISFKSKIQLEMRERKHSCKEKDI